MYTTCYGKVDRTLSTFNNSNTELLKSERYRDMYAVGEIAACTQVSLFLLDICVYCLTTVSACDSLLCSSSSMQPTTGNNFLGLLLHRFQEGHDDDGTEKKGDNNGAIAEVHSWCF